MGIENEKKRAFQSWPAFLLGFVRRNDVGWLHK
jgi:hypothetical protein